MPEVALQQHLANARRSVKRARDLLANPRACPLGDCIRLLFEAQHSVGSLVKGLAGGTRPGPELRTQSLALQQEVRQAAALLEQAAGFGRMWLERLRAANCGYTKTGAPAPLAGPGRISAVA